ncbi:MAG: hypothetical protein KatS3mg115_1842 [Candidatus Poribacteria bacterium]|nr:MAG: hypothetical protein KatS3mg115_1842 [Candidatus Poribacteria bacterium]
MAFGVIAFGRIVRFSSAGAVSPAVVPTQALG